MSPAQLEIIAASAEELVDIAAEMRRSRLTVYADRIDRKARMIVRIAQQETATCNSSN